MGFNLQSGHHSDVLGEDGELFAAVLIERLGPALKLGKPGSTFVEPDEMGWSWWSELGNLAEQKLGSDGSKHIRGVDAWCGVYVDADVERAVLWPRGESPDKGPARMTLVTGGKTTWGDRLRALFGLAPKARMASVPPEVRQVMLEMAESFGARANERSGLQVGNLRGVLKEAETLLAVLGYEAEVSKVSALLNVYRDDPERCDDDPGVQCLCHLWRTATHAVEHGQPMWLIK